MVRYAKAKVYKAKKTYSCEDCLRIFGEGYTIAKGTPYLRQTIFGRNFEGDEVVMHLRYCRTCAPPK